MRRNLITLGVILLVVAIAATSVAFQNISILGFQRGSSAPLGLRMGLDIQGGTLLVYQTVKENPTGDEMEGLVLTIRNRIDTFGVTEPQVQQQGDRRILLQLPGIEDIEQARQLVGQTAELDFRELVPGDPVPVPKVDEEGNVITDDAGNIVFETDEAGNVVTRPGDLRFEVAKGTVDGRELELTGRYLRPNAAAVSRDQASAQFQVTLGFDGTGEQLLEQITTRNEGSLLGIFIDGRAISTPVVRSPILAGQRGVIEGLSLDEARLLAIQLNSGALPLSIELVQERDVNPILGASALEQGVRAGLIGLGLVLLFLAAHYRLAGVTAAAALVMYTVLMLAAFKLFPVTLTLSGLAAFILSIGMAVDANVLIFERMKEEIKAGRTLGAAIEAGFDRAWPAIRDGNVSTLLTCLILFWFADRLVAPFVMGFAVTLFIGVLFSMLTAILVTRTLLRLFTGTALSRRLRLFHA